MNKICLLIFVLIFLNPNISLSTEPNEFLNDANLEIRARDLSKNIRCLVCQNQSIDDSNSELAKDLRMIIRNKLSEGQTNNQILDFLVSKYGEFILMKPKLSFNTIILWTSPIWAGVFGLLFLFYVFRKKTN